MVPQTNAKEAENLYFPDAHGWIFKWPHLSDVFTGRGLQ